MRKHDKSIGKKYIIKSLAAHKMILVGRVTTVSGKRAWVIRGAGGSIEFDSLASIAQFLVALDTPKLPEPTTEAVAQSVDQIVAEANVEAVA